MYTNPTSTQSRFQNSCSPKLSILFKSKNRPMLFETNKQNKNKLTFIVVLLESFVHGINLYSIYNHISQDALLCIPHSPSFFQPERFNLTDVRSFIPTLTYLRPGKRHAILLDRRNKVLIKHDSEICGN